MQKIKVTERPILQAGKAMPEAIGYGNTLNDYMQNFPGLTGQCSRLTIREGFDLSIFDFTLIESNYDSHQISNPCISIYVMLQGHGYGEIVDDGNKVSHIPYSSGKTYISFIKNPLSGGSVVPPNTRFIGIDLRFSLEFIDQLKQLDFFKGLDGSHPAHLNSCQQIWVGNIQNNKQIDLCASYILNTVFNSQSHDLQLESKALTILNEVLECLNKSSANKQQRALTKTEKRQLKTVIEFINADLAHDWTIPELAHQVGLSSTRLKIGFKQFNGQPIGRYIQNQRLLMAKQLIDNDNMTITESSLSVGYSSPSYFARIFKRKFGYSPSQIK
jgi:AraC-like DNA-binding protein